MTGKRDAYWLFFMPLGSRKARVSPATLHPDEAWVKQQARDVLMWLEDSGVQQAMHLIRNRDAKFARSFDGIMKSEGIKAVKTPVMAPDANAFAKAWVGTIKRECLNHFAYFSLNHLDHIVQTYANFCNHGLSIGSFGRLLS